MINKKFVVITYAVTGAVVGATVAYNKVLAAQTQHKIDSINEDIKNYEDVINLFAKRH